MRRIAAKVLGAAIASLTLGCTSGADEDTTCARSSRTTPGVFDRARFAHFDGDFTCLLDCGGVEEPIAERSRHEILVFNRAQLPEFVVSTPTPEIAEFTFTGDADNVTVETKRSGTAVLELRDLAGVLIDYVELDVQPVARVEVVGPDFGDTLTVMNGGAVQVDVDTFDANGCPMFGVGSVDYSLGGGLDATGVSLVDAYTTISLSGQVEGQESVVVGAARQGDGVLEARAVSGASVSVPLSVVTADAVSAITLSGEGAAVVGQPYFVDALARTSSDERVYSPECTWAIDPPGQVTLDSESRDSAVVTATAAATAMVNCSVGPAMAGLGVTFE